MARVVGARDMEGVQTRTAEGSTHAASPVPTNYIKIEVGLEREEHEQRALKPLHEFYYSHNILIIQYL